MRDTAYRVEQPGEAAASDVKDDWRSKAKEFLKHQKKRAADDAVAQPKKKAVKPLDRIKAYDLLLAKDHILSCITGKGLKQFVPQEEDPKFGCELIRFGTFLINNVSGCKTFFLFAKGSEKPLMERHCFIEQSDQGPIPMSAESFETHFLRLRKWPMEDPWHVLWRSILSGMKAAGPSVWSCFMLGCIYLNFKEGPWNGQKWFCTMKEGFSEWRQTVLSHLKKDPLVSVVVKRMERFGVEAEEMYNFLSSDDSTPKFLQTKGAAVQPSRWWSWQDAMLDRLSNPLDIHIELLVLLFNGIQMGYLLNDKTPILAGLRFTDSEDLRGQARSASNLRSRCKNTLHAVTATWAMWCLVMFLLLPLSIFILLFQSFCCICHCAALGFSIID